MVLRIKLMILLNFVKIDQNYFKNCPNSFKGLLGFVSFIFSIPYIKAEYNLEFSCKIDLFY